MSLSAAALFMDCCQHLHRGLRLSHSLSVLKKGEYLWTALFPFLPVVFLPVKSISRANELFVSRSYALPLGCDRVIHKKIEINMAPKS